MVNFTGLHSLLIKGCTNLPTCKASSYLISCLTLQLDILVVDPTQNLAAPMNVVALLPYLFITYEDANNLCITSAHNIVRVYTENLHREPLNQHDPLQQKDLHRSHSSGPSVW